CPLVSKTMIDRQLKLLEFNHYWEVRHQKQRQEDRLQEVRHQKQRQEERQRYMDMARQREEIINMLHQQRQKRIQVRHTVWLALNPPEHLETDVEEVRRLQ
uniref:Uncharacterized protein n=1 Tax=Hucho hucho TaxID=62062 RepID=A0A4W5KCF6_9TELE